MCLSELSGQSKLGIVDSSRCVTDPGPQLLQTTHIVAAAPALPCLTKALHAGETEPQKKASTKQKGRHVIKDRVVAETAWIVTFLKMFFYLPLLGVVGTILHESIPNCFGSPSKAWHTIMWVPRSWHLMRH